jgi:predicted TIM-barrel fold metal-dependent hydrolase
VSVRIVDGHVHILDPSWIPEGMRRAWARQGAGRRHPERDPEALLGRVAQGWRDPDGTLTIAAWDRAGVAGGVAPVVDWTIVGAPCGEHLPIRELNARNAELARRHRGRYWFCAGIDPRHHDARTILDEALELDGCVGIKLYPAAGWDLADPAHDWVYQVAHERGVPIVVHTAALGGDPLVTPASRPAALAPVMARHPEVTWVLGHAGFEAWWLEAVDVATGWRRAFLDLSLWQHVAARDLRELRARVRVAVERVGAHRIIFGSDIIRGPGEDPDGSRLVQWIEWFRSLAEPFDGDPPVLSAEELELAMAGSAALAYGIEPEGEGDDGGHGR